MAWYYLLLVLLNGGACAYVYFRLRKPDLTVGLAVAPIVFLLLTLACAVGVPIALPHALKEMVNRLSGPVTFTAGSVALFTVFLYYRRFFTRPIVAWVLLNVVLLFFGLSMGDGDFRRIVTKPDNVPIVAMIFLVGGFSWFALWRGVQNDERIAKGQPTLEQEQPEKVLVWPDLVYTELIAMVVVTVVLVAWAIVLKAPLEQPASLTKTPNPSKAPWYFLGLQEMLVYYDPWMAGVVLPSLIIVGLMAIPYIDFNPKGSGYFTFAERKFSITMFMFGFLVLWVTLILLGTFFRGPNWNFFGPYEEWDIHKLIPLNNVNLSEYFWMIWLPKLGVWERGLPTGWFVRELPGLVLALGYVLVGPPLLAQTVFRRFVPRMGFVRFFVLAILVLFMASLPIKMLLRWTINLKYIVAIPEFFFNI